jgi:AAA15 family ATPase/GTPase
LLIAAIIKLRYTINNMSDNHLKYFKIENFKKFESLEVKDIGQFNLIVGDNNVGKTCLLEALLIDKRFKNTLNYYYNLLIKRNLNSGLFVLHNDFNVEYNFEKNLIAFYQKVIQKPIRFTVNDDVYTIENRKEELRKTNDVDIQNFIEKVGLFDYSEINKKSSNWLIFKINNEIKFLADISSKYYEGFLNRPEESKIPNVPALMLSDKIESYIGKNYELIFKELNLEERIFKLMHSLFPNIEITAFQRFDSHLGPVSWQELNIKTKQRDTYHNIREYGDGFVRCLYMIVQILTSQSSKLVIDEIDTGIHHTKLEEVWKTILELCKELDIQLFATTHSKECAEAYIEATKKLNINIQNGLRLLELYNYNSKVENITILGIDNIDYTIKNEPFRGENIYV